MEPSLGGHEGAGVGGVVGLESSGAVLTGASVAYVVVVVVALVGFAPKDDRLNMDTPTPTPAARKARSTRPTKRGPLCLAVEFQKVLFGKYAGTEVKVDGTDLIVMREDDIMGVIEG